MLINFFSKTKYFTLSAMIAVLVMIAPTALAANECYRSSDNTYVNALADHSCPAGYIPVFANPLGPGTNNVQSLLVTIIADIGVLAIPVLAVMILWGAFTIMTSEGNAEHFKKGQKIIVYAILGFVIIILGGGVGYIINNILTPGH